MEIDKDKLKDLYKGKPSLEKLFVDLIDTDLPVLGRSMVKYNKTLDRYRGTRFFDVFPQYEKYEYL